MVQEFKEIKNVTISLVTGEVTVEISEGAVLASGSTVQETKKIYYAFSDVLKTPQVQETPPMEDVAFDPKNPEAHLENPSDANSGIKKFQPETPKNRKEMFDERLNMVSNDIGDNKSKHYLKIKSVWEDLLLEYSKS